MTLLTTDDEDINATLEVLQMKKKEDQDRNLSGDRTRALTTGRGVDMADEADHRSALDKGIGAKRDRRVGLRLPRFVRWRLQVSRGEGSISPRNSVPRISRAEDPHQQIFHPLRPRQFFESNSCRVLCKAFPQARQVGNQPKTYPDCEESGGNYVVGRARVSSGDV